MWRDEQAGIHFDGLPTQPSGSRVWQENLTTRNALSPLVRWGDRDWFRTPAAVADFNAGRDVDDEREAAVVTKKRLGPEADEALDLRSVWIDRHEGSCHGAEFAKNVPIETPPGMVSVSRAPPKK